MNLFFLNWKKAILAVLVWIASILLHNILSGLWGNEEAFFFIIAIFIIPVYIMISVIYTIVIKLKETKNGEKN